MSEKLTKLIVTTILNQGVKGSEVKDWHFKVREVDGIYYVDVASTIAISPKTELTREEKFGRFEVVVFFVSFFAALALGTVGMLIPDAYVGRDLVLFSTAPSFLAQLIGARFLVRSYRRRGTQGRLQQPSQPADEPGYQPRESAPLPRST